QLHQRPTVVDVGLAVDAPASCLPADLRPDVEPVDTEVTDMDVETGEDRALPRAGLQLGQPDQRRALGGQAIDVQLVVEPSARRPVELDVGRGQEHAPAVGDADVPQLRFAEDRSVDPPDADAKPGGSLDPGDSVDDPAVPRRAVEQDQQNGEQEQQRDEQSEQLVEQPPRPIASQPPARLPFGRCLDGNFGHQKACPSDTVTANGPSPFWRLSGTPKSTRIGPKLE